jgi:hypothetical protein
MANIRLFEHSNIAGRQLILSNPRSPRYLLATASFLNEFDFNDITSSVRLSTGPEDPPQTCFLFENDRFNGKFKAYAFNETRNIISLPYYNDLTSSVILVSHDPSPRLTLFNLRQLLVERINQAMDRELTSFSEVTRNENTGLKFVVDAYEIGQFGNDLLKIEIPLTIHTPFPLKNYRINLDFFVDLFLDQGDTLKAGSVGWHYLIEPGVLSKSIETRLKLYASNTPCLLESIINQVLQEFNWQRWKDVYLLPGMTDRIDKDYEGDVNDDCTLVLVHTD